jgi:hypothetical protein
VVSNHVIEHVGPESEQRFHLAELRRVLKPEGRGYLAVPNRWMLVEPHYRLAFLSWLPRALRTPYLRAFGKGEAYDCEPLQMRQLEGYLRDSGLRAANRSVQALRATLEIERPRAFATRLAASCRTGLLSPFRRLIPTHIYTFSPDASGAGLPPGADDPSQLACITVTFAPDLEVLRRQLAQLPRRRRRYWSTTARRRRRWRGCALSRRRPAPCSWKTAPTSGWHGRSTSARKPPGPRAPRWRCCCCSTRMRNLAPAASRHCSRPGRAAPHRSRAWLHRPGPDDATTGALHGFHRIAGWRWSQVQPAGTETRACRQPQR